MPTNFYRHFLLLCSCTASCLLGACAYMHANAPRSSDMPPAINLNGIMVGTANRLALYTYDGDTTNQSNCLDSCTATWLPFYASEHDVNRGDFSVFTRQDGRKQWSLAGKPLYFWASETQAEEDSKQVTDARWKVFPVPR